MLDFKPFTIDRAPEVRKLVSCSDVQLCDYAPCCLFMWREYYRVRLAVSNGMLVCCAGMSDPHAAPEEDAHYYSCPVGGGSFEGAVMAIANDARERGIPLRFSTVPEEYVQRIVDQVGGKAVIDLDAADPDYLYPYGNFLGYPGKALHAQRNHVNRFMRENPDASYEELTGADLDEAIAFLRRHHAELEKTDALAVEELIRSEEAIRNFEALGGEGGLLRAGGEIVGVTLGEAIGGTLHVSVEKALHDRTGAFQTLAMSYAEMMKEKHPELEFINRQDDSGDEGLRRSKQSYKPIRMLKKCTILFDQEK